MKKIILTAVVAFIFAACDRDMDFPTKTITEPSLEVQVELEQTGTTYPKVEGATVELYRDNTLIATKTSDSGGRVKFSKAELGSKGRFQVVASKDYVEGGKTVTYSGDKSDYMLLNDGETFWSVTIVPPKKD